eukprot:Gregarina_sp_Poly_1__2317@NODE_161_length_12274_cov_73_089211_g143_i0_p7_GENE_NODE_161_length_12274_cov_73_089211_g143_i0NODE_161_length_12274_cov_73_089211_g143_i0_p7_ORF_typecomplete_len244_score32_85Ala_racemase_N/PF01168_20/4_3e46FeoB_N/PF02421_18/0_11GldM_N/PF12081_8/5_8GldM_N/PF12081_8/81_NODE_161_length_12274_cov_73_089211_g143_i085219252
MVFFSMEQIQRNYNNILTEITQVASQRNADEQRPIELVVVSKLKSVELINYLHSTTGHCIYGENYVQELVEKIEQGKLNEGIKFVFIGHLQKNKVKDLINKGRKHLIRVETVDSVSLAEKLQAACSAIDFHLEVMIQINTSHEVQKNGLTCYDEIKELSNKIINECPNLELVGYMTVAAQAIGSEFADLRNTAEKLHRELVHETGKLNLKQFRLSMGMSADFREAILSGSTEIRVGSAILGSR